MTNLLSQPLTYAIAWTVVHAIWQGIIIAFIAGILVLIFRSKNAAFKYRVYSNAMLTLMLTSIITFAFLFNTNQKGQIDQQTTVDKTTQVAVVNSGPNSETYVFSPQVSLFEQYINQNLPLITIIWVVGLLLSLLRLIGGISYVHYLKRSMNFPADEYWIDVLKKYINRLGIQKEVDLLESALVKSPVVIGHLKPIILFPIGLINKLNPEEVEAILSHELAHVLRNDYLVNILLNVIESLFYYHPAVWWLSSQVKTERENCCDDIAIELCGNKVAYAKSLVTVQEMAYYSGSLAMAFGGQKPKSELGKRVLRIMAPARSKIDLVEKYAASSVLIVLLVIMSIAAKPNTEAEVKDGMEICAIDSITGNNEVFLKYLNEGKLDSLCLPNSIEDGIYTYHDELQKVSLTVKKNFVVQFNINGLEVLGKDIPKFSNVIYKAITYNGENIKEGRSSKSNSENDAQIEIEGPTTYLGNKQIFVYDKNGDKSILDIDDNGGQKLTIYIEGKEPIVIINEGDHASMNGKKLSAKDLSKLGWKFNEKGIQPIYGFINIRPMKKDMSNSFAEVDEEIALIRAFEKKLREEGLLIDKDVDFNIDNKQAFVNDKELPDALHKKLLIVYTIVTSKAMDDGFHFDHYYTADDENEMASTAGENVEEAEQIHKIYLDKKFDAFILKTINEEGMVKARGYFNYALTKKSFIVDGKKASQEIVNKITNKYKEIYGMEMEQSYMKTYNATN